MNDDVDYPMHSQLIFELEVYTHISSNSYSFV